VYEQARREPLFTLFRGFWFIASRKLLSSVTRRMGKAFGPPMLQPGTPQLAIQTQV